MSDPNLKSAAWFLAEHTPEHLGKPTLPPQAWWLKDGLLYVLLADGRKFCGPVPPVRAGLASSPVLKGITVQPPPIAPTQPVKKQVEVSVTSLPVHTTKRAPLSSPKGKKV